LYNGEEKLMDNLLVHSVYYKGIKHVFQMIAAH